MQLNFSARFIHTFAGSRLCLSFGNALSGTRFLTAAQHSAAVDVGNPQSMVAVVPGRQKFLSDNKLLEVAVEYAGRIASSLSTAALRK